MIKSILKISTFFVLFISLSLNAFAGKDRGGGNVFEAEFKQLGYRILNEIRVKGLSAEQIGFETIRMEVALEEVRVLGTDRSVSVENTPRMSINSPRRKVIIFSNASWMILNHEQKKLLVLHEYLRFVGVDDSEYTFSLRIAQLLQDPSGSTSNPNWHSTQARVFRIVAYRDVVNVGRVFTVIEERSGSRYEFTLIGDSSAFGIGCDSSSWLYMGFDRNAVASGLRSTFSKLVGNSRCENYRDIMSALQKNHPVKIVIDPVKALSNEYDYLTIEY